MSKIMFFSPSWEHKFCPHTFASFLKTTKFFCYCLNFSIFSIANYFKNLSDKCKHYENFMSEFRFIYSELWPTCHLPDEWKMSRNAKSTKNDFLGNSQVKCVSRLSNKNFYLQSHKIFYQIFIKPTKMPNKTCWIINNNNLPPFCASFISPTQTLTVGCLEIFSILDYFLLLVG